MPPHPRLPRPVLPAVPVGRREAGERTNSKGVHGSGLGEGWASACECAQPANDGHVHRQYAVCACWDGYHCGLHSGSMTSLVRLDTGIFMPG
jgi:hypothetical protein